MNIQPVSVVVAFVDLQRRTAPASEMRRACDDLSKALIAKDRVRASAAAFEITHLAQLLTSLSSYEREMFAQIGYHWQLYR